MPVTERLSSIELAEKVLDLVKPNPDDIDYEISIDWTQADSDSVLSQTFKERIESNTEVLGLEIKQDNTELAYKLERLFNGLGF